MLWRNNQQLTFNILTFIHRQPAYTFHFSYREQASLHRVHKYLVPDEVVAHVSVEAFNWVICLLNVTRKRRKNISPIVQGLTFS